MARLLSTAISRRSRQLVGRVLAVAMASDLSGSRVVGGTVVCRRKIVSAATGGFRFSQRPAGVPGPQSFRYRRAETVENGARPTTFRGDGTRAWRGRRD